MLYGKPSGTTVLKLSGRLATAFSKDTCAFPIDQLNQLCDNCLSNIRIHAFNFKIDLY